MYFGVVTHTFIAFCSLYIESFEFYYNIFYITDFSSITHNYIQEYI